MNTNIKMITENGMENIAELKGLLANAKRKGLNKFIISVPVNILAIDTRYQTPIRSNRKLDYLTKKWNENMLLPLTGVPHEEDGVIVLVDGMGRTKASQIVDANKYEYLECMIIMDAPRNSDDRLKFEAELFAYQNRDVAKLTPVQKHGALRCIGDPAILALDELQEKYGFSYVETKGVRAKNVLGSYSEAYATCKSKGKDCMDFILDILKRSAFDKKSNGYSVYMMRGLRDIWSSYPDSRKEISDFLSEYLRKYEPETYKAKAVSRYDMLDYKMAVSLYTEDLVTDNLGLEHVRKYTGGIVRKINAA